jgi:hypothetical protein
VRAIILLAAACCGLLVGCGQSAEEKRQEAARQRAALRARRERKERDHQQFVYSACSRTFSDLQDRLGELDSRLSVGMNFESYGTAVADVRVVYDKTDFRDIALPAADRLACLSGVGVPLERALNEFVAAYTRWNDCISDIYCDADSIDSTLQAHWGKASRAVEKSRNRLEGMQPPTS